MMKPNLLMRVIFKKILLVMMTSILLSNIAYANDEAAIKATFLDYSQIQFGDTRKAPWRIVQAKSWKEALAKKKVIAEGMSSAASVATLSVKQRQALYNAWQKTPQEIWVIYFSQPDHFELNTIQTEKTIYEINLVPSLSDADQAQRDADEQANMAAQKPLSSAIYTQADFDTKLFTQDFADWQKRFKQDVNTFEVKMRKDHEFGRNLLEDKNPEALKQSFGQSIDVGHKGLSFRQSLISAYYAPPGHEGTEVTPSGYVIRQLVLSNMAKPVGYGGNFIDEGKTIELWYMVFDDMSSWTVQDFNDRLNFKAFSPAILPPYKTIKRNSWPALVFTRGSDGKIQLYSMSMELSKILGTIYNAQLF
ncbi:MAG: hypothetical protein WBP13_09925 [Methylophilaceae bacterium]